MDSDLTDIDYIANRLARGEQGNVKYMFSKSDWTEFKTQLRKILKGLTDPEYLEAFNSNDTKTYRMLVDLRERFDKL